MLTNNDQRPTFRHPDLVQVQPWREWMRRKCPTAQAGFIPEDLDLMILLFSELAGRSYHEDGRFLLADVKHYGSWLGYAQRRAFGLMHYLLRLADPECQFYRGFYVVHWNELDGAKEIWNAIEQKGHGPYSEHEYNQYFDHVHVKVNGHLMRLTESNPVIQGGPEFNMFLLGTVEIPSLELMNTRDGSCMLETENDYRRRVNNQNLVLPL